MTLHDDRLDAPATVRPRTGAPVPSEDGSRYVELWEALAACTHLGPATPERDALWLCVQSTVCTRRWGQVTPMGSTAAVPVTGEHATDELIAAMSWLIGHERAARALAPLELYVMLRGVATKGSEGSGRAARADALHGMTGVPRGRHVNWRQLEDWNAV